MRLFKKKKEEKRPEFRFRLQPITRRTRGRVYEDFDPGDWAATVTYFNGKNAIVLGCKYGYDPAKLETWLEEWPEFFKGAVEVAQAIAAEKERQRKAWTFKKVCVVDIPSDKVQCYYERERKEA